MSSNPFSYEKAVEFSRQWDQFKGDERELEKHLGIAERNVRIRRRKTEEVLGIQLKRHAYFSPTNYPGFQNHRFDSKKEYTVLIGSDKHNYPGERPQAFKAFLHLLEGIKPDLVCVNGDFFDFPAIGRFHRIGWQDHPDISEELEDGVSCLNEIKTLSPKSKRYFNLGNHDMRFDGKLSNCMPELEGIKGCHLDEYLKGWNIGLSLVCNDTLMIKHRWHQGQHSSFNDVVKSGSNIVTGHDHKLNIRPYTDYKGTRYGIKSGTLSDLYDEQFMYTENNPVDWQPGCVVITVIDNIIFPVACPIVIDKSHRKHGKLLYNSVWYG